MYKVINYNSFEIAKDRAKHLSVEDLSNKFWYVLYVYIVVCWENVKKIRQIYICYMEWLPLCENSKYKIETGYKIDICM